MMHRHCIGIIVLILACGTLQGEQASASDGVSAVIEQINDLRIHRGLNPVLEDREASLAAQSHAAYLAETLLLSHRGSDGARSTERYRLAGGSGLRTGENLGAGDAPGPIIAAWMNSPSHKQNLLSRDWYRVGVGIHRLQSNRCILVAVFTDARWQTNEYRRIGENVVLEGLFADTSNRSPAAVGIRVAGHRYPAIPAERRNDREIHLRFTIPADVFDEDLIVPAQLIGDDGRREQLWDMILLRRIPKEN